MPINSPQPSPTEPQQQPICADRELNQVLEKQNERNQAYAQRADHAIKVVEAPTPRRAVG